MSRTNSEEEYWSHVPEFESNILTYKSTTYLCYYIDFDYVGTQYKYPNTDDIVVLLDIDISESSGIRHGRIIPYLRDQLWFEFSDWNNVNGTNIGLGRYFVVLAFPLDTERTDIFECMRYFVSNVSPIKYLKVDDDQIFTNNIIDYKSLMIMNLKTFTLYDVGIKEQKERISKLAVMQDGLALKNIKEQTEEICKLAVQDNGMALKYVKDQTEEICKLAIQRNWRAYKYIKK